MMNARILIVAAMLIAGLATAAEPDREDLLSLDDHAGDVVYVDFWASWCKPCKDSFPWLMSLHDRYAEQGLTLILVNVDRDDQAALGFLEDLGAAHLNVVYDPEGKIAGAYGLEAMPSSYVYGRDGALRATHIGFAKGKTEELEMELLDLLGETTTKGSDHD